MKTISTPQFIELLKTAEITTDYDLTDTFSPDDPDCPDYIVGWIWNTMVMDGFVISYQNTFEHPEYKPSLIETSADVSDLWLIDRQDFAVVDDDVELDLYELGEILETHTGITAFDFSIFGDNELEQIDIDENSDMETFIVQRDNDRDIEFTGEIIAATASSDESARGDYSGKVGLWEEITLYKTCGGKFICERIGKTRWQGDSDSHSAAICDNENQVIEFFGLDWLAKQLYDQAGIDATEKVG